MSTAALSKYACPECDATIVLPVALRTMGLNCPECGAKHTPSAIDDDEAEPQEWTPTGEPEQRFGPTASAVGGHMVVFALSVLAGLGIAGAGVWIMVANPGQVGMGMRLGVGGGLLAFGLLIAGTGVKQIRTGAGRVSKVGASVFPDGLLLEGEFPPVALRWDNVKALVHTHAVTSPYLENNPMLMVARAGDEEGFIEASIHRNNELLAALQQRTLPHLLPEYEQALAGGARISFVDFGPHEAREEPTIHVGPEGIKYGDRELAWSDLREVRNARTQFALVPRSGRTIKYNNPLTIPNLHVLVALVEGKLGPNA